MPRGSNQGTYVLRYGFPHLVPANKVHFCFPADIICMKTKLKSLHIKNFGAHENTFLSFEDELGIKPISLLFGCNGSGKSTILEIIRIITNHNAFSRDTDSSLSASLLLRPWIRGYYNPICDAILTTPKKEMRVEAIFVTE